MDVTARNHVAVSGRPSGRPIVFSHGFGCDQNMWRLVAPAFEDSHRVILFDHVGFGRSDLAAWSPDRYASLEGYARDVLELCAALGVEDGVFVGHSVSAMIGALAAIREPSRFSRLVMVGPSPRYVDDGDYVGGFTRRDIDELLATMDGNYLGWSQHIAPVIMGVPDRPELGEELAGSFCRTDPDIAKQFAAVTVLSDNRADLPKVTTRSLILQSREDAIAPPVVGEYVHRHLANSRLVILDATGHCPHLSAPDATIAAMKAFLNG